MFFIAEEGAAPRKGLGKARQATEDRREDLVRCESVRSDGDVVMAAVERIPLFIKICNGLPRRTDDTPGIHVVEAVKEPFKGDVEEDDRTRSGEVRHGPVAVDDASAGGDDMGRALDAADILLLQRPKTPRSLGPDDLLEASAFPGLDEDVRIQKIIPHPLGQQHAHGALPNPGHPDQYDVSILVHPHCHLLRSVDKRFSRRGEKHTGL